MDFHIDRRRQADKHGLMCPKMSLSRYLKNQIILPDNENFSGVDCDKKISDGRYSNKILINNILRNCSFRKTLNILYPQHLLNCCN